VMGLCVIRPEGVNALMETLPKIGDGILRANLLSVLEHSMTPEIEPACASFVAKWVAEDPHVPVRMTAARVLGAFTNSAAVAVPALTKALMDKDGAVRITACNGLGRFGKEAASATVPLRSALNDSNPQVRADAARALQAIGASADQLSEPASVPR
jgi:HEAT repeats